jgi:hypothetical protein
MCRSTLTAIEIVIEVGFLYNTHSRYIWVLKNYLDIQLRITPFNQQNNECQSLEN